VIIDDFDVDRASMGPDKTNSILIVYSNGVLPGSITAQGFEPIARRDAELVEIDNRIEHG
jgi:hypothetical protein